MPTVCGTITEAEFRRQVIYCARLFGWACAAIRTVRVQRKVGAIYYETPMEADGCGWPDVFLVHEPRKEALALELKIGKNKATPAQIDWLRRLNRVPGITAAIIRPSEWKWLEERLRGSCHGQT